MVPIAHEPVNRLVSEIFGVKVADTHARARTHTHTHTDRHVD